MKCINAKKQQPALRNSEFEKTEFILRYFEIDIDEHYLFDE